MAAVYQAPGRCQCPGAGAGCSQTFAVVGCSRRPIPGATVTVWTDSTKNVQLATGTTGADGKVALSWSSGSCSIYYEYAAGPRFNVTSASAVLTPGSTTTKSLTAANGYHCSAVCAYPLKDTLYSNGVNCATLTYGNWVFGIGWFCPGGALFPGKFFLGAENNPVCLIFDPGNPGAACTVCGPGNSCPPDALLLTICENTFPVFVATE
jgi:hypothetical protein